MSTTLVESGSGAEHAIDDDRVELQMAIELRPETVNEGDRAEARLRAQTSAARAPAASSTAASRQIEIPVVEYLRE